MFLHKAEGFLGVVLVKASTQARRVWVDGVNRLLDCFDLFITGENYGVITIRIKFNSK